MNLEDFKKQRSAKVVVEYELNDDEFEKLIENKLNRARAYREALYKREEEVTFD
jgi:hypothetical protein